MCRVYLNLFKILFGEDKDDTLSGCHGIVAIPFVCDLTSVPKILDFVDI
jgi:hypothetical protein